MSVTTRELYSTRRPNGARHTAALAALLVVLFTVACTSTGPAGGGPQYTADVTRTEFGIPHVVAPDEGSLGYGIGYAYAQDNFCMLAEKINQLNGERSRFFGPDAPAHVATNQSVSSRSSDFFFRSQFPKAAVTDAFRTESPETVAITRGYAAGVNRYLRETGVQNLPLPCRGAAWVRPLDEGDLYLWYAAVATLSGSQGQIESIVTAEPPVRKQARGRAGDDGDAAAGGGIGSNAWAFGSDATVNRRGLLFGNPHWHWGNMNQFYQAHLTIPGQLDVMGATYGGMPAVVIGFNRSMAWSHTVSTGARYVIRELTLAADSPTAYMFDGTRREMQRSTITIDVLGEGGAVLQESRTFYRTHLGPLIVRDRMPWSETTAYALTDVNLDNRRMLRQWMAIAKAADIDGVRTTLAMHMGIPWVNTIAADANGGTLYADYSLKPYVTDEMMTACGGSDTARRATTAGALTLDGSRSACDPRSDPATPQRGILPPPLLPMLQRTDYVANSNNTYWLTNPASPITGVPLVAGRPNTFIGFRPQSGLRIIASRLAGTDTLPGNRFDAAAIKTLVFGSREHPALGNHNRAAEVALPGVRAMCADGGAVQLPDGRSVEIAGACRVLSSWDARHAVDSAGGHLFREFWSAASRIPSLWATPFDPQRPLDTPRDLNVSSPEVRAALRQALAAAVVKLDGLKIPLDRKWGEVHAHALGDRRIPMAGAGSDTLNLMTTEAIAAGGWSRIVHGASYVQIVGFGDRGPEADAVLLFGQSANPESPFYYDQLQSLWVRQEWNRLPFDRSDVERRAVSRVTIAE